MPVLRRRRPQRHKVTLTPPTFDEWQSTFETNVTALYFTSTAFLPLLGKATQTTKGYSASIANIASISGMMRTSSGGQFAYAASKAAAIHVSKMLGTTLAQAKVRVNTICPGWWPSLGIPSFYFLAN